MLTYPEALVVGALQGVTELFPVSSLGHSVLVPALVGGRWARDLDVSAPESPYLAFIVGLHVATAVALVVFFRRDWARVVLGLVSSVRHRRVREPYERLAWLLVAATVPVGITGVALEHVVRTVLATPAPAAGFLIVNGLLLLGVERLVARSRTVGPPGDPVAPGEVAGQVEGGGDELSDRRLGRLPAGRAVLIGAAQIAALLPGVSRSGSCMAAGLLTGLSREDAARFSFLLATPVIAAAGVFKAGDLLGPLGAGIRGQVVAGSLVAAVAAYVSVRFLVRWFEVRSLRPFGAYCVVAGVASLVWLAVR